MTAEAVLLAETDPRSVVSLPRALFESLPHLHVHTCASADSLIHQLRQTSYETVGIHPLLMDAHRCAIQKKPQQLLAPFLVTAGPEQHPLAQAALGRDARDLIVKLIIPLEAMDTVRLAFWPKRLLRLLTTTDQAASRFRERMTAFPMRSRQGAVYEHVGSVRSNLPSPTVEHATALKHG